MGQVLRILIIAIVIWFALMLLRRALRSTRSGNTAAPTAAPRMLPCAKCGVHVPETEALTRGGRTYCCKEHVPLDDA